MKQDSLLKPTDEKLIERCLIRQFENVTSFIKRNETNISTCLDFRGFSYKHKNNTFITIGIAPATLGTMLDILASWHINNQVEIDKYGILNYKTHSKEKIENMRLFKKAYIAANLTQEFRSGYNVDLSEIVNKEFTKQEVHNLNILHNRIKRYLNKRKNKIDNPKFSSYDYFLKGDGDFIYEDTLCDMKSSKYPSIKIGHIKQLFIYWFINEDSKDKPKIKTHKIKNIEIYNPLYDYHFKIKIEDLVNNVEFMESIKSERTSMMKKVLVKCILPFVLKQDNIDIIKEKNDLHIIKKEEVKKNELKKEEVKIVYTKKPWKSIWNKIKTIKKKLNK